MIFLCSFFACSLVVSWDCSSQLPWYFSYPMVFLFFHHEGFSRCFYLSPLLWCTWCLILHLSWMFAFDCLHSCKSVESTMSEVPWSFISLECWWDCVYSVLATLVSGPSSSSFLLTTLSLYQASLMSDWSWLSTGSSIFWEFICFWSCPQDFWSSSSYHLLCYVSWAIMYLDSLWPSTWLFSTSWWRFYDYT